MGFDEDLAAANMNEMLIRKLINPKDEYTTVKAEGEFSHYDFKYLDYDYKETYFECKEDFMCKDTGNIAIELEYKGRLSGLNTTKSDYYVITAHYTPNGTGPVWVGIYQIETERLKELVLDCNNGRMSSGGDGNQSRVFLMPRYIIAENSECLLDTREEDYNIMLQLACY